MLTFAIELKIVHYTPRMLSGYLVTDSIEALAHATEGKADVTIATSQAAAIKALESEKPDIVHVHVCWSWWARKVISAACRQGCAIVMSPHGRLSAYTLRHEKHLRKQLWTWVYQKTIVHHCDALLAEDDREASELERWHDRIGVVPNTLLNSVIGQEDIGTRLMAFYKKVIDTRYPRLMAAEEKEAVFALLHVGIDHDQNTRLLSHEDILSLRALKPSQWRRIMLLADDEDIRILLDRAIAIMQLDVPVVDGRTIDRFTQRYPKKRGSLPVDKMLVLNPIARSRLNDTLTELETDDTLRPIVMSLINARQLLGEQRLSLRHLVELYEDIRYTDFDEDTFSYTMRKLGMRAFVERLTALLHHRLRLEEGFWPVRERMDKKERKMERQLQGRN